MDTKVLEFHQAMERYQQNPIYQRTNLIVSVCVVFLQTITTLYLLKTYDGTLVITLLLFFVGAYITTDFINGFVHMYMDNNTNYTSIFGPFISAFHLHHAKPRYTYHYAIAVYFFESGTKFWLLIYLAMLCVAQHMLHLSFKLDFFLVCFGLLSSFAEVSHYWCHHSTSNNYLIYRLQRYRILLSKKHHAIHHLSDNTHYAFLNGMTDPVLNFISRHWYDGYKNHADQHAAAYHTEPRP